jgi:hypothetical protein
VLIEPGDDEAVAALATAEEIGRRLNAAGDTVPRLLHGVDGAAWPLLDGALRMGLDIRIGLEDTLALPDGRRARDNADLVALACDHARRAGRI